MPQHPPGPYPKGDRADELQQSSLLAFKNVLLQELFLVRDERVDDKGVDLSIELKHDGAFLNIRSQVQIKGTNKQDLNADGSFSYPMETRNLNYLLNGACPLYVVWIAPRKELMFVWARDEARRLHRDNPDWRKQGTVTLRFTSVLSGQNVKSLYERILQEGKFQRETHDILARATVTESVVVGIKPESLTISDPDKLYDLLRSSGLSLVTAGYSTEIIDILRLLKPDHAAHPRILLVSAYAHLVRGEYLTAGGFVARCKLAEAQLSALDQHFLAGLKNASQYHNGLIDIDEYIAREKVFAKDAPVELALQHELEAARLEHINAPDEDERSSAWRKLRATVAKITADQQASAGFKLKAQIVQLYADAYFADSLCSRNLTLLGMRKGMGLSMDTTGVRQSLEGISNPLKELIEESGKLVKEAQDLEQPLLSAEALVTQAVILIARTATCTFFFASRKLEIPSIPKSTVSEIRGRLEQAVRIFSRADHLESELWAKLCLADWLDVVGEWDEAKRIAECVRPPAMAMGYKVQLSRAEAHLSGETEYRKMLKYIESDRDMDVIMAKDTDDRMKIFARTSLAAMELPPDRLPVVERDCLCMRDVAIERVRWCRHIGITQDLRHTLSPQTMYLRDPNRWCICEKFDYKSNISHPDWQALISAFKQVYCDGCSVREPKVKSSS